MTPAERLRTAADLIENAIGKASPEPWTYFEDHGRDHSDEGWSEVGVLDAEGKRVALTYPTGEEHDRHEFDAALIVFLSATGPSLIAMMRQAEVEVEAGTRPDSPKPDRDPVEGDYYTVDGQTWLYSAGDWRRLAVGSAYSRALLDVADAILSTGRRPSTT